MTNNYYFKMNGSNDDSDFEECENSSDYHDQQDFLFWKISKFPNIKQSLLECKDVVVCNFWVKNIDIIHIIYTQLQNNNHINYSFRQDDDAMKKDVSL